MIPILFALLVLLSFAGGPASQPSIVLRQQASPSTAPQIPRDPRYPAHWWTPVIDPKKPEWEILPQEAAPGEVILSKRN